MSLTVKDTPTYKSIEPGTYPARCIRTIDLGTQHGQFEGKETVRKQVIFTWELTNELMEGGELEGMPYIVSRFYTTSLNKKATLRKDLEAWRGKDFTDIEAKGFQLQNMLGKTCMLSITHNEAGKARVKSVMALPRGVEITEAVNPLIQYDIDDRENGSFNQLSDGIKEIIRKSDEFLHKGDFLDNTPDVTTETYPH